ncbi:MAG: hypothetical protein ABIH82_03795 [Candidatus Woesearchaeota archaeon]
MKHLVIFPKSTQRDLNNLLGVKDYYDLKGRNIQQHLVIYMPRNLRNEER